MEYFKETVLEFMRIQQKHKRTVGGTTTVRPGMLRERKRNVRKKKKKKILIVRVKKKNVIEQVQCKFLFLWIC